MDALATQLTTLQQQLAESTGTTRQQLAELGRSQTAVLAAQSVQGAVLARLAAAAERSTALAAGEGSQQGHQHQAQRARLQDQESPLDKDVVLDNVFSYVGTGDYLYTGAVSRRWRGRYKLCYSSKTLQEQKLCTTHGSAVMTAARLQLALRSKLQMAELQKFPYNLARNVVMRSLEPRSVLSLAKLYDLKWSDSFTTMAARTKQLEVLQWLHESGCPIYLSDVVHVAVYHDHVDMLTWVHSIKAVAWSQALLQQSFKEAGRAGGVGAAAWLRRQGARWLDSFVEVDTTPDTYFGSEYCKLSTVKWALANGCTWEDWRCQDLAPEHICGAAPHLGDSGSMAFRSRQRDKAASVYELFVWAHENGCPCTCEDPTAAAAAAAAALAAAVAKTAADIAALRARSAS
jgi:hypothetical protein